ncbi:hypothetical protein T484DRAFT_1634487, partial [Baffinella frigidus]
HPKPETRNPEPGTRNPKSGTRNPEPGTRNPKSGNRNPEPETRNSEPETRQDPLPRLPPSLRPLQVLNRNAKNPPSETREPKTHNPKPETRNPKTEKPKTGTRNSAALRRATPSCTDHNLKGTSETRSPKHETRTPICADAIAVLSLS